MALDLDSLKFVAMGSIPYLFLRTVPVLRSKSYEMILCLYLNIVLTLRVDALFASHNSLAGVCECVTVDFHEKRNGQYLHFGKM